MVVLPSASSRPLLALLSSSSCPPLVLRSSSSRPTLVLLSSPLLSPCVNILAACAGDPARVGKKYDLDTPNVLEMKPWGHQSLPKSTIWEAPGATWSTLGALGAPLATLGASWGRPWDHTWPKTGAKRSQKNAQRAPRTNQVEYENRHGKFNGFSCQKLPDLGRFGGLPDPRK